MFNQDAASYLNSYPKYKEFEYATLDTILDTSHSFNEVCARLEKQGTPFNALDGATQRYILREYSSDIATMINESEDSE